MEEKILVGSMARTTPTMIQLECLSSFDFESSEYRQLFGRASASAFQHPVWLTAFYRHLVRGLELSPLIVVGRREENGILALVIPLVQREDKGQLVIQYAFEGVTDYACPVIEEDIRCWIENADSFAKRFRRLVGPLDRIEIEPVRDCDRTVWASIVGVEPVLYHLGSHSVSFRSLSQGSLKAGWARNTNQLTKKARRLCDLGRVTFAVVHRNEVTDAILQAKSFRRGRFTNDPIQNQAFSEFYAQVAVAGADSGYAITVRLSLGTQPLAVAFAVCHQKTCCYLILGCDYDRFGKYSPGLLILNRLMAEWRDQGGRNFDFTIGDEPYKSDVFQCVRQPMYKFTFSNAAKPVSAGQNRDASSRSLVIVAHPDDELLWFSSLLADVDGVVMSYLDYPPEPPLAECRRQAIAELPFSVTSLSIPEAGSFLKADWSQPELTPFGIKLNGEETLDETRRTYEVNCQTLITKLRPLLTRNTTVYTHNPWGEYGHEDHIQVFRAVDMLRKEFKFPMYVSAYYSGRSQPVADRYLFDANHHMVSRTIDRERTNQLANIYKRNRCWTWSDDWRWPSQESFITRDSLLEPPEPEPKGSHTAGWESCQRVPSTVETSNSRGIEKQINN